ncbi:hypothetical protein MES5069_220192 [Mesorhizobium escarrei]|uniref:Uncharacterized protein n=1 Tax=Mesorhizobium escarrei TaxID=666018 RepID=A0ABN8JP85_9HYPH|nr:hypothetical protein MES5069_220192 [Mesorhizobium escarrei]
MGGIGQKKGAQALASLGYRLHHCLEARDHCNGRHCDDTGTRIGLIDNSVARDCTIVSFYHPQLNSVLVPELQPRQDVVCVLQLAAQDNIVSRLPSNRVSDYIDAFRRVLRNSDFICFGANELSKSGTCSLDQLHHFFFVIQAIQSIVKMLIHRRAGGSGYEPLICNIHVNGAFNGRKLLPEDVQSKKMACHARHQIRVRG